MLFDYDCPINVQEYDPNLGVKEYCTISGALDYTYPFTVIRYYMVIHQAVHMSELWHHLLCPMKCRTNGVIINECPHIYCSNLNQETHVIVKEDEYDDYVILPLFLNGGTSHLNVDTLTQDDFEANDCPRLTLAHRDLTWDLSTTIHGDQENYVLNYKGDIVCPYFTARGPLMFINSVCMFINSVCVLTCEDTAEILSKDNFANVLQ